jgi:hypothetical protein
MGFFRRGEFLDQLRISKEMFSVELGKNIATIKS